MFFKKKISKDMFLDEHNKISELFKASLYIQEKYDDARLEARCKSCKVNTSDLELQFEDRCKNCRKDSACINVKKLHDELSTARKKEDEYTEKYAKLVFDKLSEIQPNLIRRKDKEKIKWSDAFGKDFTVLSINEKRSIVSLIEEDGGKYCLAK